jgi:SAM dependent carboxyl methyltransferase
LILFARPHWRCACLQREAQGGDANDHQQGWRNAGGHDPVPRHAGEYLLKDAVIERPNPVILPPENWRPMMPSYSPNFIETTPAGLDDLVDGVTPATGAMEGGGAYNKHAKLQAGASASALPSWKRAVERFALDCGDQPVVIADYGSSQGKNSLAPMRAAVEIVRLRAGQDRPIFVHHVDLAINDFNALFALLTSEPDCYGRPESKVYSCAVGRSFYESVLPPNHVHVGWSSFAANWISRIPTPLRGHIFVPCSTGVERSAFERQAAQDWERFLSLRAKELRPGGRLVVVVPGTGEDGVSGFENIMNVLVEMVEDGAITADEYERMALGLWPRRRQDLLAPFVLNERFQDLIVESRETTPLTDAAWALGRPAAGISRNVLRRTAATQWDACYV